MTSPDFFLPAPELARALIGATLLVDGVGGIVVETEAYDRTDPASHSFNGPTPRNAPMFGPPGRAYVYRSYGIHWCLNVVCGPEPGGAVLIRALEPMAGHDAMAKRRGLTDPRRLCSGPGRLCQALAVNIAHNGLPLRLPPFQLFAASATPAVLLGRRIGITKAVDRPWRFGLAGSAYLTKPFAPARSPATRPFT
jgi:DNA-3-methyladenine glycosylase